MPYNSHSNISVAVSIVAGVIFPLLCTLVVGLRFYERRKQASGLGTDDWLTIPALVGFLLLAKNIKKADISSRLY